MQPPDAPLVFAATDARHRAGRKFGILPADLARHVYVVGKTGSGKTTLLERLLKEELEAGHGVGLIDPHGDLAERVLGFVPRNRSNDVVYFDPADRARPVGLNLLSHQEPSERPLVVSGILSVFRKVFADFWGPRLEHVFRNCLLALLEVRGSTLLGVVRLLSDERYRARVVRQVADPLVRHYWTREFESYPKAFLAEVVAPVQNKAAAVLTNPLLRNIVGQHRSAFSAGEAMDGGRIFVANLAKGRIGEDASAILGAVLLTRFQLAAYARADRPPAERRPFTLYVDELASFATPSFGELLSEARKYRLALVLAHQYLGQLDDRLRAALMGNVGTLVTFQLGAEDADILGREFLPELTPEDLTRLAPHQIALRLAVDGSMSRPFTALTLPPAEPDASRVPELVRLSRERYGRDVAAVEEAVRAQLVE